MLLSIGIYMLCGAIAGILAGLLGVGGGLVIVPMLDFVFIKFGYDPNVVHQVALGTSLATIIVTSISSSRAHHQRGAVRFDILKAITPGILVGTFCGGLVASRISPFFLKAFFVVFLLIVAMQMLSGYRPKAGREIPGPLGTAGVGGVIGVVSSFVGIGGGTLSVPFMTFCNVPIHHAVGTSAAIGFPIAVAGATGYVLGGWGDPTVPPGSLGYVNLLAFAGIASVSFFTAPIGARISHALPTDRLKKGFAFFLILVAIRMFSSLF